MADAPASQPAGEPAPPPAVDGRGFSFPFGIPLLLYPLLFILGSRAGWLGSAALAGLALCALLALWQLLSEKAYAAIRAGDPTLNRLTWRLNWLLLFLMPALALLGWALARRSGAAGANLR